MLSSVSVWIKESAKQVNVDVEISSDKHPQKEIQDALPLTVRGN